MITRFLQESRNNQCCCRPTAPQRVNASTVIYDGVNTACTPNFSGQPLTGVIKSLADAICNLPDPSPVTQNLITQNIVETIPPTAGTGIVVTGQEVAIDQVWLNGQIGGLAPQSTTVTSADSSIDVTPTSTGYNVQLPAQVLDTWHYFGASGEPAFQNSFSSDSQSGQDVRFRKENNIVYVEGWVNLPTTFSIGFGSSVFTGIFSQLPVGYRPLNNIISKCIFVDRTLPIIQNLNSPCTVLVDSSGFLTVQYSTTDSNHYVSVTSNLPHQMAFNFSFIAEQ